MAVREGTLRAIGKGANGMLRLPAETQSRGLLYKLKQQAVSSSCSYSSNPWASGDLPDECCPQGGFL